MFPMLSPFLKNNHNLTNINIRDCDFGIEGARLFALALGSITNKSLQKVELEDNNISEEGMVDVITALSMPSSRTFDLDGNCLRKDGCWHWQLYYNAQLKSYESYLSPVMKS